MVQKVSTLLKKKYDSPGRRESLPVIEELVMAVLAEGATTTKADAVFQRLKKDYFDWNEVRVSAVAELQSVMSDLPDSEHRAARLKTCLKHVFEKHYTYDLESFRKIAKKEAAKQLGEMPQSSAYVVDRVIRDGLGGTNLPLDGVAVRVLTRLELIDEKTPRDVLAGSLERQIPRVKSFEFTHLLAELGADTCLESEPRCKQCCLFDLCASGHRILAERAAAAAAAAAARRRRPKSKSSRKTRKRAKARSR